MTPEPKDEALRPCPFCGEDAAEIEEQEFPDNSLRFRARCPCCLAMSDWWRTRESAARLWNRRPIAASGGVKEARKKIMQHINIALPDGDSEEWWTGLVHALDALIAAALRSRDEAHAKEIAAVMKERDEKIVALEEQLGCDAERHESACLMAGLDPTATGPLELGQEIARLRAVVEAAQRQRACDSSGGDRSQFWAAVCDMYEALAALDAERGETT